ncbi:hypothetical protein A2635_01215 [Candidatus Peribacteria bacterium RIFCSPHIGHO2_01_FULL_51_9]|nr:MAG: hypothetical protein A2635_01215 [Candidatus Peribacteria bacterium RIFCSPHIGHO2_01_FULL_51_9]
MHIVLLNDDSLPTARGGAAVVVDMLQRGLEAGGHRVTLITTHRSGPMIRNGTLISIPVEYPIRERHFRCIHNPEISKILASLFHELRPDIVHAHNIHTYLTYDALHAARRYTDHIFLTAHDTFLVSFGRVKTPHRMHFWEHLAIAGRRYNPWRNSVIRHILQKTETRVIAISKILKSFLEMNEIPVSAVVYNGTDLLFHTTDSLVSRAEVVRQAHHDTRESVPTILTGGRVSDDKGMSVFFKAAAIVQKEISDVQFCIVGDKERIQPYLTDVSPKVREQTVTPGWLSREEMHATYDSCDVVTTPSIYLDPFNLMNIEAMAHGKPVVGTCFGGTPEIVEDNITGLIRDPKDTDSYAAALVTLLKNKELAKKMGEAGRKRMEEKFSVERMLEGYLHAYGE